MQQTEYETMYRVEDFYWWFAARKKYLAFLLQNRRNLKILDFGCGTGGTTKFLTNFGQVTAVDIHPQAISFCQKRGINASLISPNKPLPFKDNSFDLVTALDVLYHKKVNSDFSLKEINRVLKKNGLFLITNPTLSFLSAGHDKVVHTQKRASLKEIHNSLIKKNFSILFAGYIFFLTLPLIFVSRKIIAKIFPQADSLKPLPSYLNQVLKFLCDLDFKIFKTKAPIGSSIIFLCQNTK